MELSESEEEYLESLYNLSRGVDKVKVSELADDLEISAPSTVEMLEKLDNKELVNYEKSSGCSLTDEGENIGRKISRRHRVAERFLSDMLDRDLSQVHDEACELEHSLADKSADEIANILGNPDTCPHGQPIPKEGEEEVDEDSIKLAEAEEGREYDVKSIPEREGDVQRLLPLAILPGSRIKLAENPSSGALMVKRGSDKLALSRDIASKIEVCKDEERKQRRRHRRGSRR